MFIIKNQHKVPNSNNFKPKNILECLVLFLKILHCLGKKIKTILDKMLMLRFVSKPSPPCPFTKLSSPSPGHMFT